jgi:DNA topoisomerase-1
MQRSTSAHPPPPQVLRELGLHYVSTDDLTIERKRRGAGFVYLDARGHPLRDERTLYRLKRLAVPPAYEAVRFAPDPHAHLQAVGRDAAGRAQYRYHPDWEKVRELRKARRLSRLAEVLPVVRRWVSLHLKDREPTQERAVAAVIELVALTALRPGSEAYSKQHGTRGAATLLKSDVKISGAKITLHFVGKGGKNIEKTIEAPRLAQTLQAVLKLPGKRVFQYRNAEGAIVPLRRRDVNAMLQTVAGRAVSMKDFRTLTACGLAIEHLATLDPKPSERGRKRQLIAIMREIASELANTPAVCRKSYVHAAVVEAFESGALRRIASRARIRSASAREKMLAKLLERIALKA